MQPDSKETASTEQLAQDAQPNGGQQPQKPAQPNGGAQQAPNPAQAATAKGKGKPRKEPKKPKGLIFYPEAHPQPVSPRDLLLDMYHEINKHVAFPDKDTPWLIVLWIAYTHFMPLLNYLEQNPYLNLSSPTKGCGKSTLRNLACHMSRNGIPVVYISAAAFRRLLNQWEPTLCMDEVDKRLKEMGASEEANQIRIVLNAAFDKENRYQQICDTRNDNELLELDCWRTMILTGTGKRPEDTEDRCLTVVMRKSRSKLLHWGQRDRAKLIEIRARLRRFAVDNCQAVDSSLYLDYFPNNPADLRAMDVYRPLLAIAHVAGLLTPDLLAIFERHAQGREQVEKPIGIQAMQAICELADQNPNWADVVPSKWIARALGELDETPFAAYGRRGKPISQIQLANLLKKFGLETKKQRVAEEKDAVLGCYNIPEIRATYEKER